MGVTQGDIVRGLAANPYLTATKIAKELGVAFTTAQRTIVRLQALDILAQVSEGRRDRIYCAREVLAVMEEPTRVVNVAVEPPRGIPGG